MPPLLTGNRRDALLPGRPGGLLFWYKIPFSGDQLVSLCFLQGALLSSDRLTFSCFIMKCLSLVCCLFLFGRFLSAQPTSTSVDTSAHDLRGTSDTAQAAAYFQKGVAKKQGTVRAVLPPAQTEFLSIAPSPEGFISGNSC